MGDMNSREYRCGIDLKLKGITGYKLSISVQYHKNEYIVSSFLNCCLTAWSDRRLNAMRQHTITLPKTLSGILHDL